MADQRSNEVNARVVYWGIEGSGKSANLNAVYAKLRPDHRSEIRHEPTRFDPTVAYEVLPIELGEIAGVRTRLQIIAAPAGADQSPTRKQLLDQVDGVVLVFDCQPERRDENLAHYQELCTALAAYGRRIDSIPLVVQYNKRDLGDPYAIESLHRKLEVGSAPVFEAVATEGIGVLQTLSTISKRVIRSLRDQAPDSASAPQRAPTPEPPAMPEPPAAVPEPLVAEAPPPELEPEPATTPDLEPPERMERAILEEPQVAPDLSAAADRVEAELEAPGWDPQVGEAPGWEPEPVVGELETPDGNGLALRIVSVGRAEQAGERRVRVPLVIGDSSGQTTELALTIELDPLMEEGS